MVVRVRKRLEKSVAGHVGPRAIQQELVQCRLLNPPPGLTTIKRWLKEAGLLDSPAEPDKAAYYPEPQLGEDLVIFACDWTERYFTGGEKVFVFHTIDLRTHALAQTLRPDKSTESAWEHLLACGSQSGLPDFLQLDNDGAFTGLGRTPHVFGRFVRLALYLGIEPLFIPPVSRSAITWSKESTGPGPKASGTRTISPRHGLSRARARSSSSGIRPMPPSPGWLDG